MFKTLRSLIQDEQGQGLAEYGLILALVAVVAVAATRTLGTKVSGALTAAGDALP